MINVASSAGGVTLCHFVDDLEGRYLLRYVPCEFQQPHLRLSEEAAIIMPVGKRFSPEVEVDPAVKGDVWSAL